MIPSSISVILLTGCLADIRPDTIEALTERDEAAQRGRAMLEAAAEAHGGRAAWQARRTVTVELTDTWSGFVGRMANPWPAASVRVRLDQRLHSFDSRATFQGELEGLVWGITDGRTWRIRDGAKAVEPDADARFILPTMHYFTEIPYRLLEAPIILDAGPETIDGVTYPRVFVTWDSVAPNSTYDQYVVYLDPDTSRIAKTYYTVREIAGFVTGTMNYEDYVDVDGAMLPTTMYVSPEPADGVSDNLHIVEVASWAFDEADPAVFELPRP